MKEIVESYFGKDLVSLKNYQEWIREQIETSLEKIREGSGLGKNPYQDLLESLTEINKFNLTRLQARKSVRKEGEQQKEAQKETEQAYDLWLRSIESYNQKLVAALEERIKLEIEQSSLLQQEKESLSVNLKVSLRRKPFSTAFD
jgi:hypothetical protein